MSKVHFHCFRTSIHWKRWLSCLSWTLSSTISLRRWSYDHKKILSRFGTKRCHFCKCSKATFWWSTSLRQKVHFCEGLSILFQEWNRTTRQENHTFVFDQASCKGDKVVVGQNRCWTCSRFRILRRKRSRFHRTPCPLEKSNRCRTQNYDYWRWWATPRPLGSNESLLWKYWHLAIQSWYAFLVERTSSWMGLLGRMAWRRSW